MKTAKDICEEIKDREIESLIDGTKYSGKYEIVNYTTFNFEGNEYCRKRYSCVQSEISAVEKHEMKLKELGFKVEIQKQPVEDNYLAVVGKLFKRSIVKNNGKFTKVHITISACCGES